jgi:hypothetical protein
VLALATDFPSSGNRPQPSCAIASA